MTWIRTIPLEEADAPLRQALAAQRALYPLEYTAPNAPGGDSVVASHTLMPAALLHIFSAFGAMMSPDLPLSRAQHEMIATMVSATNHCFYWVEAHAEFLRRVTLDETMVASLRADYQAAAISVQDRVMLDYVVQLTKDATRLTPHDHDKLRAVGFDDQAILQITLIASWFNYINRAADALGVGRGKREDWLAAPAPPQAAT